MRFLEEHRRLPAALADHLPWAALVAPGVILNKDGSFTTGFRFRGPDLESSTEDELMAVRARLNNALKRLTTLTLGVGETLVSKAAGDTVRWQIGETTSGDDAGQRTHVLLKPLQRGLETNLVLTTNRRVYFIDLKSGDAAGFNAAVAWDTEAMDPPLTEPVVETTEVRVSDPVAVPEGPIDARYRIEPQGRRARWTPASVFNDGRRTFIAFDPDLQIDEAPALFVIAADGETQLVNYRQAGGLFIVDRVFDRAELRLGDRRPQIVRIRRLQGAAR